MVLDGEKWSKNCFGENKRDHNKISRTTFQVYQATWPSRYPAWDWSETFTCKFTQQFNRPSKKTKGHKNMFLTYIPQLKLGHKPPCGIHRDALGPIYKHQKFFQPQIFAMHANTWYFYYSFPSTCKFYNRELNNIFTQVTNLKKTSYFAQLYLSLHFIKENFLCFISLSACDLFCLAWLAE